MIDGGIQGGPEVRGGRIAHVPGHPHAVAQVRQALGRRRLLARSHRRCRLRRCRLCLGGPQKEAVRHPPQQRVHLRLQVQVGRRIRVCQRRLELLLALLPRPAAREPGDSGGVANERPGRLVARGRLPRKHLRRHRLQLMHAEVEREPPCGPFAGDIFLRRLRLRVVVAVPGAVLRRDVPHVCVEVALGGLVGGALLEGAEPPLHVGPARGALSPHLQALPVQHAGHHALHVAHVLQVHQRGMRPSQEPGARGHPQLRLHAVQRGLKVLLSGGGPPTPPSNPEQTPAAGGPEDEAAPIAEQLALEAEQAVGALEALRVAVRGGDHHLVAWVFTLDDLHDDQGFRNHLAVDLYHRQES
mmetsp:Transcript_20992/g.46026  ORF Transcript_20992/g.46026 Transcript_20992/m.46026 type:complete len:357 (-) Transcript_20992:595-1665(-)